MKWFTTIVVALLSLSSIGEEYRIFTDQQGRTIKAKIVSFDSKTGKITIERDNRRKATVSPSAFCEEDQEYITQWAKGVLLKDKSAVSFSISTIPGKYSEYELHGNKTHVSRRYTRFRESVFNVEIKNKSNTDFGTIVLEYCTFIERKGYGKIDDISYCETGSSSDVLNPSSSTTISTEKLKVFERFREKSDETEYYKTKDAIESIKGVIFRVYVQGYEDSFVEFAEPANFKGKYQWKEFRSREGIETKGLLKR
jgi:hypothetical protein